MHKYTKTSIFYAALGALSCAIASCSGEDKSPQGAVTGSGGAGLDTGTMGGSSTSDGTTTTASSTTGGPTTMGSTTTTSSATSGSTETTTNTSGGDTSGAGSGTTNTSGNTTGANTTGANTTGANTTGANTTGANTTDGGGGSGGTGTEGDGSTAATTTGSVDDGDCMTPPDPPPLEGWAAEAGGTMGGGDANPVVVGSASELNTAASGTNASVIYVNGSLSGDISIGSNKTIVGVCGAEFTGSIRISGQQNIILRNIKVTGYNCSDSPGQCSAGADAISVRSSNHIWFDHLDVSDGSDGNLDMTNNADYITISWTKFYYSTARTDPVQGDSGHRFSNLIAGSDSDSGDYRITFHHNWWAQNVDQRMPRTRFGDIHVFNNLFTSSGNLYCTNAGYQTHVLVENNVYRGVNNPLSPDGNGDMHAEGNVFDGTSGNQSDNGGVGFDPPYNYTLDPTDGLDTVLQAEVGPHD